MDLFLGADSVGLTGGVDAVHRLSGPVSLWGRVAARYGWDGRASAEALAGIRVVW